MYLFGATCVKKEDNIQCQGHQLSTCIVSISVQQVTQQRRLHKIILVPTNYAENKPKLSRWNFLHLEITFYLLPLAHRCISSNTLLITLGRHQ